MARNIDRHIRFAEVFTMQTATSDRPSHIRAEFAISCACVHVRATNPFAEWVHDDIFEWNMNMSLKCLCYV